MRWKKKYQKKKTEIIFLYTSKVKLCMTGFTDAVITI